MYSEATDWTLADASLELPTTAIDLYITMATGKIVLLATCMQCAVC